MQSFSVPEHGTAEIYMIQGSETNPHIATTSAFGQFEVMDNEGASEFIVDQGMYYPDASNYYGYYSTEFEMPTGWEDSQRFFGLDNPNLHYAGLQAENLPYVYYTPSYGFAQSPYNPYNPYIPGAVIGVDGSFVGMQQYYPGSTYQQPTSSSAYYPLLVQPMTESIPNNALEPHFLNASASKPDGSDGSGLKHNLRQVSGGTIKIPSRPVPGDGDKTSNQSLSSGKKTDFSTTKVSNNKQPSTHTSTGSLSVTRAATSQASQGRNASGSVNGADQLNIGQMSSLHTPVKGSVALTNASPNFSSNARGWPMVDKLRPRLQYGGVANNANGNPDFLSEQNRGPRTNRSRGQWTPSSCIEVYKTNAGTNENGQIIINSDQYNKEDFPVTYVGGKFFVIKSYSEDDVHKSIKYNVWSSTPNGNKRLDSAYADAQRLAAGNPRGCPVFLFFSVNASGQFCGVAEMIGPVDFNKDMNFWQQDKWSGSFPVKWHIIKDVPNTNFRHIILENNENKPVTNSRDTQEIKCRQGMEMLSICKNYTLKTSILDDFMYYEERQKIMQEEKARLHGKTYDSSFYIPAFVPPQKPVLVAGPPPGVDETTKMHSHMDNPAKKVASSKEHIPLKVDVLDTSSSERGDTKQNPLDENGLASVLKIGSITIDSKSAESKPAAEVAVATTEAVNVFTVGSMPVKVNGHSDSSSGVLKVGSIPIVPKGLTLDKPRTCTSSGGCI